MNTRLDEESDSNGSDDDFDLSDTSDRKRDRGEQQTFKNQPFDEAVDLSNDDGSDDNSSNDEGKHHDSNAKTNILKNQKYDECLDVGSPAQSKSSPERSVGQLNYGSKQSGNRHNDLSDDESVNSNTSRPITNQPFDEVVNVSDDEDDDEGVDDDVDNASIDTKQGKSFENTKMTSSKNKKSFNATQKTIKEDFEGMRRPTPKDQDEDFESADDDEEDFIAKYRAKEDSIKGRSEDHLGSSDTKRQNKNKLQDSDSDSDSDVLSNGDGGSEAPVKLKGGYNSKDYANLKVSNEVSELFESINRYKPHDIELESTLKCFIPEYIPAIGEMDAFLKMGRPDGKGDDLGLHVLDEPAASQSDSTVLELQLRAISKRQAAGDVTVRSIENAAKNPAEIDRWINSINELHRSKPPPQVHYRKSMPDIEQLMDVWPEEFEEALNKMTLPHVDLDMSLEEYAKIICALVDIPVYEGALVESLHVLFTLYLEFKHNQHFMTVQNSNNNGTKIDEIDRRTSTVDDMAPPSN